MLLMRIGWQFLHRHPSMFPNLVYLLPILFMSTCFLFTILYYPTVQQRSSYYASVLWKVPIMFLNQTHVGVNDFIANLSYFMHVSYWPIQTASRFITKSTLIPMLLFVMLLLKKPPDPSLDFWHIKSKKVPSNQKPTLLHGRNYCLFSSL